MSTIKVGTGIPLPPSRRTIHQHRVETFKAMKPLESFAFAPGLMSAIYKAATEAGVKVEIRTCPKDPTQKRVWVIGRTSTKSLLPGGGE